ncbi:MAG: AsmA-like C-terminal region-containing protein [Bacteroidota bacterium]
MKVLKKIGWILLITIAFLVGVALLVPVVFKDKITGFAKDQINQNIDAEVDFESVNLSFFRSFPNLSFRLQNFSVVGKGQFEGTPLVSGENFDVAVDLTSVIRTPVIVKSIQLDKPDIQVYVLEDGNANYNIVATDTTSTTSSESGMEIALDKYEINEGRIHYDDKSLGLTTTLENINHEGSGNLSASVFDLDTETEIEYTSLAFDGIQYLDSATVNLDAILHADLDSMKYTLRENELNINELILQADGFVQLFEDQEDILMDLSFNAPESEFKELLSLLPNAYTQDFKKVKADGTFQFNGFAKGTYRANAEEYPAFQVNLNVAEGEVRYPDLPMGINEINLATLVDHPGGNLDGMTIDISQLKLLIGEDPVEGFFKIKTPISDPFVDGRLKADLDLANVSKAYPLDGVRELAGRFVADITAQARQSSIEAENYSQVNMKGQATVQDVLYVADNMPEVRVKDGLVNFTPQHLDLVKLDIRLGKSDLYASGKIYNPLAVLSDQTLRGDMRIRSNYFNADEWLTDSGETTTSTSPKVDEQVSDQYRFNIDAEMRKIDYDIYQLTDLATKLLITANEADVSAFSTNVNGSSLSANGKATNLYNFLNNGGVLGGAFDLNAGVFDLDQLMADLEGGAAATEGETSETTATASIPDFRYNIDLNVNANRIVFEPYDLTNLKGTAQVTEKQIVINQVNTNLADGQLNGSGTVADYMEYAFLNDTVRGDFKISSAFLNLNSILASEEYTSNIGDETPTTAQPEDLEAFIFPVNWNFKIDGDFKEVLYADLKMNDVVGTILIEEGALLFQDTKGKTLGGQMAVTGGYDTQNPEAPAFDIKLTLEDVGIGQAFTTFNTFEKFAPIGGFIDGKMNTSLLFSSILGQDMMPDLKTVNMEGFIETLEASIKNFKPIQAIGNTLDIREVNFDRIGIQNTKNWFTINDGKVRLEEAKLNFKDIQMTVSGESGLDSDMNFDIIAFVPKVYMGNAANKGLNLIQDKASGLGLNLNTGSHVKMRINMTGTMTAPKLGVTPLGMANLGEVTLEGDTTSTVVEPAVNLKQQVTDQAKDKVADVTDQAKDQVNTVVDSAKTVVQTQIDSTKANVKKQAEEAIGEKAEEIKEHLDKYNPFKKRKKKSGEGE